MSKVRPVLILLATLAAVSALYYTQIINSHKFAFGWKVILFDVLIALLEIFVIISVIWLSRSPSTNQSNHEAHFLKSYFGRIVTPKVLYIISIIVMLSLLISTVFLFLGYMGDEWGSPPTNERSFPAPKKY